MEFFSPVNSAFMEMEFDPIIKRAKGRQLNFSLEKIKKFSFSNGEIDKKCAKKNTDIS